jgi:hypothetical protein
LFIAFADDIRGELRRNLNVVPRVTITSDSNLLIVPTSAKAQKRRVVMSVTNNAPRETRGTLRLDLPSGWTATPASKEFALKGKGEKTAIVFDVNIPANAKADSYQLRANAIVGGKTYNQTMFEVAYPHIQTHRRYAPAEVSAKVVNLKVAPVRVGYIMGTGDRVPEAIKLLGLNVAMLDETDLSTGDLLRFDTIVVGFARRSSTGLCREQWQTARFRQKRRNFDRAVSAARIHPRKFGAFSGENGIGRQRHAARIKCPRRGRKRAGQNFSSQPRYI